MPHMPLQAQQCPSYLGCDGTQPCPLSQSLGVLRVPLGGLAGGGCGTSHRAWGCAAGAAVPDLAAGGGAGAAAGQHGADEGAYSPGCPSMQHTNPTWPCSMAIPLRQCPTLCTIPLACTPLALLLPWLQHPHGYDG